MNASDKLADLRTEHDHEVEFYKNSVVKRMLTILRQAQAEAKRELLIDDITELGKRRTEATIKRIEALISAAISKIGDDLDSELLDFTASELSITQAHINGVLTVDLAAVPAVQQVYASAMSRPFQGALLKDWYKILDEGSQRKVRMAITNGITLNETESQIVSRVRDAGVTNEHNLSAIIRTAINHVSTFSRHSVYSKNSDLIKGWYFMATLDSKTTPVCRAADGKFHKLGEGKRPPLHIGCRSSDIPILKSNISGIPEGVRASIDGEVPAELTYNEFLKRKMNGGDGIKKDRKFVKEVLGPSRYQLFKDGDLSVTKFVNRKGKQLTLDEIRRRYPDEWKKSFGSSDADAWRDQGG